MAGTVDVEHDGFFLRHVLEDTGYPEIATIIKRAFDTVIPRKAIDFRSNVGRVIQQCLSMHGVPMFRTRYAGEPFGAGLPEGGFALMVCYGSHDGKLKGVWFKGVPPEDLDLLAAKKDGYMLMLRKYLVVAPVGIGGRIGTITFPAGQAIVSEAAGELQYLLNGKQVDFEEFSKAWLRDFPNQEIPRKSFHRIGMTNEFTVSVQEHGALVKETALEAHLMEIENRLKDALADEEKAVPFYRGLLNDIENTRTLNLRHTPLSRIVRETDRYLYSMREGIGDIGTQESKHKERIANMIKAIKELRKTLEKKRMEIEEIRLELQRTRGKPQVLRPLERV